MDLLALTESVVRVAEEAAVFIRSHAGKVTSDDIESKSRNSLVSFVDKQAEQILVKGLQSLLPDAGFITEEGTIHQQKSEYTWVIDPLDGTTNFLHQVPFYSVSIGLLYQEEIIIGVVNNVEWNESFYAWKNGGAWCNGERIYVSKQKQVKDSMVATGFPYAAKDVGPNLLAAFEFFLKNARGMRRLGSAAIDLAYVACGRFDVYYEASLNAWDIAGGILLVKEAGGNVTDFKGEQLMLVNGQVIASAPGITSEVTSQIFNLFGA